MCVKQFDVEKLFDVLTVADRMKDIVKTCGSCKLMEGKIMANVFLEPSTRTSSSFAAAMMRLGGNVIQIGAETSSTKKGETLQDTVRCLENYCDLITLRHPQRGAADLASQYTPKPVINAGDGDGEHPSQALLDMYTIYNQYHSFDGLTVTMVGDLKYGRTVHSLSRLLSMFKVTLNYVSPGELAMPSSVFDEIKEKGITQNVSEELSEDILKQTDVLYVTRVQQERFATQEEYLKYQGRYVISKKTLEISKTGMIVMHPLPRTGEILEEVDDTPNAAYFKQMENGMYVRMALIALVSGVVKL